MEQRGGRIADGDDAAFKPVAPQLERRGRARRAELFGERRHAFVAQRADHVVVGGKARARDAVRHHLRVAEDGGAAFESAARRRHQIWRELDQLGGVDPAAGMDHAHGDLGLRGREARQVGLSANDGEGPLVDGGAVADVVLLKHRPPRVLKTHRQRRRRPPRSHSTTVRRAPWRCVRDPRLARCRSR